MCVRAIARWKAGTAENRLWAPTRVPPPLAVCEPARWRVREQMLTKGGQSHSFVQEEVQQRRVAKEHSSVSCPRDGRVVYPTSKLRSVQLLADKTAAKLDRKSRRSVRRFERRRKVLQ